MSHVVFSRSRSENLLWKERDFCLYVLNVARAKVEGMRSAPEYKQIKYSKSNFKYLSDIAALMVKYFIKDMSNIINDTDIELAHAAVDCLLECLKTATVLYHRKFADFLKVLREFIFIRSNRSLKSPINREFIYRSASGQPAIE